MFQGCIAHNKANKCLGTSEFLQNPIGNGLCVGSSKLHPLSDSFFASNKTQQLERPFSVAFNYCRQEQLCNLTVEAKLLWVLNGYTHCMVRVPLAGSSELLPLKISDNNHPTRLKNSSLENFVGVERAGKPGRCIVWRWGCGCAPSLAAAMAAFPGPGDVQKRNHSRDSLGVLLLRDLSLVSMVQTAFAAKQPL